jgi:hypothetical protein
MDQDKLWDYLQNEGLRPGTFSEGRPRYLVRYLRPGSQVLTVGAGRLEDVGPARLRSSLEHHDFAVDDLIVTAFIGWERRGVRNVVQSLARFGEPVGGPPLVEFVRTAAGGGHETHG